MPDLENGHLAASFPPPPPPLMYVDETGQQT